jgi:hypothetical protein
MSAYYGAIVNVKINKCDRIQENLFDREVELQVNGVTFCTAIGKVEY